MHLRSDDTRSLTRAGLLLLLITPSFALPSGVYSNDDSSQRRQNIEERDLPAYLQERGISDVFGKVANVFKKPEANLPPGSCEGEHIKQALPGKTCAAIHGVGFRRFDKRDGKCLGPAEMRKLSDKILGDCWTPTSHVPVSHPRPPSSDGSQSESESTKHTRIRPSEKPKGPRGRKTQSKRNYYR